MPLNSNSGSTIKTHPFQIWSTRHPLVSLIYFKEIFPNLMYLYHWLFHNVLWDECCYGYYCNNEDLLLIRLNIENIWYHVATLRFLMEKIAELFKAEFVNLIKQHWRSKNLDAFNLLKQILSGLCSIIYRYGSWTPTM